MGKAQNFLTAPRIRTENDTHQQEFGGELYNECPETEWWYLRRGYIRSRVLKVATASYTHAVNTVPIAVPYQYYRLMPVIAKGRHS